MILFTLNSLQVNPRIYKLEVTSYCLQEHTHNTQVQFDKHTIHSHNLYQIFTYVKNLEAAKADSNVTISGMLLYAKTVDQIQPDNVYHMSGNEIAVKTLDLNKDFADIRRTLDDIAERYFAIENQKVACI